MYIALGMRTFHACMWSSRSPGVCGSFSKSFIVLFPTFSFSLPPPSLLSPSVFSAPLLSSPPLFFSFLPSLPLSLPFFLSFPFIILMFAPTLTAYKLPLIVFNKHLQRKSFLHWLRSKTGQMKTSLLVGSSKKQIGQIMIILWEWGCGSTRSFPYLLAFLVVMATMKLEWKE